MRKFRFNWKEVRSIILAVVSILILANFLPSVGELYSDLPDGSKYFVSTAGAAGVGLVLLWMKKKLEKTIKELEQKDNLIDSEQKELSKSKELTLSAESFEILMFIIMPVLALYGVFPEVIKDFPYLILLIFLPFGFGWYFFSSNRLNNYYSIDEGKIVKTHLDSFAIHTIIIGVASTFLIIHLT